MAVYSVYRVAGEREIDWGRADSSHRDDDLDISISDLRSRCPIAWTRSLRVPPFTLVATSSPQISEKFLY